MKKLIQNLILILLILGVSIVTLSSTVKAQTTTIQVDPPSTSVLRGASFDVNITITNVADLAGFEFKLYWNTTVLNLTRLRLLLPWSPYFVAKNETLEDFNATHGRYWVGASLLAPATPFAGNTTVLIASFLTTAAGTSKLDLVDTKLGNSLAQPITHTAVDGDVTVSVERDVAITQINVTPTTVVPGGTVKINATAANLGSVTETFNVTVFYDSTAIGTQTGITLASGDSTIRQFTWNTTGVALGTYPIKAEASQVPAETNTTNNIKILTPGVSIQKEASTISITANPTTVAVGSNVTISGSISPVRSGVNVTIEYRASGTQAWNSLTTVKTNTASQYSYSWKTSQVNAYELRARWLGDSITQPANSTTVTVTVQKITSTISIDVSPATVNLDSNVTISGTISPVRSGVDVTIEYRASGTDTWATLATVKTNTASQYSYSWKTSQAGTFEVRASWQGDATTNSATSAVETVTVQGAPIDYLLYVAVIVIIIIIAAVALYFWKLRKK